MNFSSLETNLEIGQLQEMVCIQNLRLDINIQERKISSYIRWLLRNLKNTKWT